MMRKTIIFLMIIIVLANISKSQNGFDTTLFSATVAQYYKDYKKSLEILSKCRSRICILKSAECLIALDRPLEAVSLLKHHLSNDTSFVSYDLARAYALSGNVDSALFWLKKHLNSASKKPLRQIVNDMAFDKIRNTVVWQHFWQRKYYSELEEQYNQIALLTDYGKNLEAVEQCNKMLKTRKKDPELYYLKGCAFYEYGDYEASAKMFSKSLKLHFDTKTLIARAKSYAKSLKFKKSAADYAKLLAIDPNDATLYVQAAKVFYKAKNYDKAADLMRLFVRYADYDYQTMYFFCKVLYADGQYLEGLTYINKMFEYEKPNVDLYKLRGEFYLQVKLYERAYKDFTQALDLNPTDAEIYYFRGIVLLKQGKKKCACDDLQKAIKGKDYRANEFYYNNCK